MGTQRFARLAARRQGFTLMELIVVIALLSIVLVFSIPRFQGAVLTDDAGHAFRWMAGTIQNLKAKAQREQQTFFLTIDLDHDRLFVSEEPLHEETDPEDGPDGFHLPAGMSLLDVSFPYKETVTSGTAAIRFFKDGYSDKALIHVEVDGRKTRSLLVEPFLDQIDILDGYVEFPAPL